jgi:hypothetical protein
MAPHPAAWAEWLLASILPAQTRESVLSDLLEEYREAQLPDRAFAKRSTCRSFRWRSSARRSRSAAL